jgi:myo-inositol 2-dehydrogenase/D-chiro-inositol 1-dehydrogenase
MAAALDPVPAGDDRGKTDLRVGIVGAGVMGNDHIARLTHTISGARVSAVIEPNDARARAAAAAAPGAVTFGRIEDALDAGAMDAVIIATPGRFHEPVLLPALAAGISILCEKPLTQDPESSWRVLQAEERVGRQLIQVGFMRRFDPEYRQLRGLVDDGRLGQLLMMHAVHRNPSSPASGYTQQMLVTDSLTHEFDVIPWLADSVLKTVQIRSGRRNSRAPEHLAEPVLLLMQLDNGVLVDVEMNVNASFGYQVATEAVFESGVVRIGQPAGLHVWAEGGYRTAEHQTFSTRFRHAYDDQLRSWAQAAREGRIAGPSAWDGYKVAAACAAGVQAMKSGGVVDVVLPETPFLYRPVNKP